MGLFDLFKKKEVAAEAPAVPEGIEAHGGADVLCAPVSGRIIPVTEVPDPVFSGEVLGRGCAIWPEGEVVYAPVSGKVIVRMGHAVGVMSDPGVEAFVHVGVDTVNLQGRGFTGYVERGDEVVAGQPILKMDRSVIAEAGYEDCVVLVVSNSSDFDAVEMAATPDTRVAVGSCVLKVHRG